jgi:molybdate transport system substrate-binding protein
MRRIVLVLTIVLIAASAGCGKKTGEATPDEIKVAAASDLAFAFKEVGAAFEKATGKHVKFTFGSTGQLTKQISEGAPYDVLAAANVSFVDDAVKADACDGATKTMYARGRIVVWTKKTNGAAPSLQSLADGKYVKIAIANPEHAPYGRAAKQALEKTGVWSAIESKIVYGENIQQTLQWAQSGDAEVAIAALSLALVSEDGSYELVDDKLHAPIDQAMVVCKYGGNAALGKQFTTFVSSPEGRTIMKKYGFLLPGETLAQTK